MIVGAGESGSDICNEVAQYADKVAIVVRGKHGHLIPRKQVREERKRRHWLWGCGL